jgi:tRNA pseudouridine55 synthase
VSDGLLLVDKPAGPTSHDCVDAVRGLLGERRVGHAGTLDPTASGLLVVVVGRATRLAQYVSVLPKRYAATLRLGTATETDDAAGKVTATDESWRALDEAGVRQAMADVAARSEQVPPAVSAKQVDGERAYRLARQGRPATLKAAAVRVHRLEVRRVALPDVDFVLECSSGTYVRAIARDVGRALGTLAHLCALRRGGIGPWRVEEAVSLTALDSGSVRAALRPMRELVAHLPAIAIGPELAARVAHGAKFEADGPREGPVAVLAAGEVLAVARFRDGLYAPAVVLVA